MQFCLKIGYPKMGVRNNHSARDLFLELKKNNNLYFDLLCLLTSFVNSKHYVGNVTYVSIDTISMCFIFKKNTNNFNRNIMIFCHSKRTTFIFLNSMKKLFSTVIRPQVFMRDLIIFLLHLQHLNNLIIQFNSNIQF